MVCVELVLIAWQLHLSEQCGRNRHSPSLLYGEQRFGKVMPAVLAQT